MACFHPDTVQIQIQPFSRATLDQALRYSTVQGSLVRSEYDCCTCEVINQFNCIHSYVMIQTQDPLRGQLVFQQGSLLVCTCVLRDLPRRIGKRTCSCKCVPVTHRVVGYILSKQLSYLSPDEILKIKKSNPSNKATQTSCQQTQLLWDNLFAIQVWHLSHFVQIFNNKAAI